MHPSRSMRLIGALAVLTIIMAACGGGAASSAPAEDGGGGDGGSASGETVSLSGARFAPAELTVPAGTTVTFTDTSGHTVTEGSNGTPVDDPIVDTDGGEDIPVTFDEPGTYNITCKIHPSMNMTITVEG